jgi:hypothetical protein
VTKVPVRFRGALFGRSPISGRSLQDHRLSPHHRLAAHGVALVVLVVCFGTALYPGAEACTNLFVTPGAGGGQGTHARLVVQLGAQVKEC